ncbi:MAG: sodium:solute symporter [Acidobacteria bacterium]|nr:sodium:solute symporter [Acidobacteriota bacterium]
MAPDYGWLSIIPPVLAIVMALRTRQVHLSLFAGIWVGATIIAGFNPVAGLLGSLAVITEVVGDPGNTPTLLFTLIVGALILLMQRSGGVSGFAQWMVSRGWVRGRISAQIISALLGVSIFIESNITSLVTGTVSRPLYDRLRISRAKLAYICDSTSAPICILIPVNAWGAMLLSLLIAEGVEDPLSALAAAIPFNFYAWLALGLVFVVAITGRDYGPMVEAERLAVEGEGRVGAAEDFDVEESERGKRAINLLLPVITMVAIVPFALVATGDGDWTQGSGATSVFWAVSGAVVVAMILYKIQGLFSIIEMTEISMKGFQQLLPVAAILALSLAIGAVANALGTGPWVASNVAPLLTPEPVAPLVFLTGCVIAFSTGSSWGTFAILMPIAVPLALESGAHLSLVVGAVMGGGIFGDHCSPISDTTVVASLSAGCDHIEHVTTQLPYALAAGTGATVLYFVVGLVL